MSMLSCCRAAGVGAMGDFELGNQRKGLSKSIDGLMLSGIG
jgi:hypothetical protein